MKTLSPEAIQAAYKSITTSLEEILRSPLPRASLEMALARLSGIGHLKSLEELLQKLESGVGAAPLASTPVASAAPAKVSVPVYTIPNADPVISPQKKNPESTEAPSRAPPIAPPSAGHQGSGHAPFDGFVRAVFQHKASLGAILEHAVPMTSESDWGTEAEIRIGFRASHGFYKLQAQHKSNFEQLEKILQSQVHRKVKLAIETAAGAASQNSPVASIVEKQKLTTEQIEGEKKKKFLEHEIVKDTKEIFGAELSSFDIDKSKT